MKKAAQLQKQRIREIDQSPWIVGGTGATFSHDRTYRYRLWRAWDESKPRCVWVMLNPSTADETKLDPTIRKCITYAQRWGCGSIDVVNLFAYRATDPRVMMKFEDPIGPDNNKAIAETCNGADIVIAAWGAKGKHWKRDQFVRGVLLRGYEMYSLNIGAVAHPLYQRGDTNLWLVNYNCTVDPTATFDPKKLCDPNALCTAVPEISDWLPEGDDGH